MRRDPNCCKKSKKSQRLRGDQTAEALLLLMVPFGLCLQAEKEGEFGRRMGNICSILSNSRCRTQFSDSWQTKQHREGAVGTPCSPKQHLPSPWESWLLSEPVTGLNQKCDSGISLTLPSRLQWASNPNPHRVPRALISKPHWWKK